MILPSRPSDFDARYLRRLVGTKVTTFYDFDPLQQPSSALPPCLPSLPLRPPPPGVSPPAASSSPASSLSRPRPATASSATAPTLSFSGSPPPGIGRSWIITERLSERAVHLAQEDVDMGVGCPMTVGKFLCHLEEDPTQIAFMRIYYQIPISGTEDADLATLAQQIQPPERNFSWSLDPLVREDVRAKFRVAFEEMLRCGVKPQLPRISKIIYDQATGNVRLSGFRRGWPILDKLQWSDTRYVAYRLASDPTRGTGVLVRRNGSYESVMQVKGFIYFWLL
ncbi:hypothetical protein N7497_004784 [Penicillium chrysogenum]|nr:hypothetical protein N7497_004784 [Penicillium chrysogenum]